MELQVSDLVRQRATANGQAGQRWLDALPNVVNCLAEQWELHVGKALTGGSAAYVAEAVDSGGNECVLKVAMPLDIDEADSFQRSVLVHQFAAGHGCARLLKHDTAAPAMLLERLGPNLGQLHLPLDEVLRAITSTLNLFWRKPTTDCVLPTGADKAMWLREVIIGEWDRLDHPCTREVVHRAVDYCDERAAAFDPTEAVVVHGDAHGWNTLDAGEGQFKFVDPEGILSEPAHDLSVPMREYNEPLLAGDTANLVRQRAGFLATTCDVDPEAVWQWGYIERVSTGFANLRDFDGDEGLLFLEVAERCL